MAFSNISNQQLGKFLQIAFSEGIRNQISTDYRDWEMVKRHKVADPMGREVRFFFQTSLGPSATQWRNPNFSANFPSAQQNSTQENTAVFKELNTTIEIEQNLWRRAQLSGDVKYAEPLAIEIESKLTASKREVSKQLYMDGTGVFGTCAASSATVESGRVRFQLDEDERGHIGHFEYDEILVLKAANSGTSAIDTDLGTEPAYWKVVDRRRSDSTVLLQGLDSSLANVTVTSISVQPAAGEVFYKYEQPTIPDLTSLTDYSEASETIVGLETLTANDGRTVHGITMQGSTGGTHEDANDLPIDISHIESVMNNVKTDVGQGQYSWKMACMAPETYSTFVESRETDRRFNSVTDETRGLRKFIYQHRDDAIELYASEYAPKKRVYILPESKSNKQTVIEWHGTDFEPVRTMSGQSDFLATGSNGYERRMQQFLQCYGNLICKHPKAVAVIKNFRID